MDSDYKQQIKKLALDLRSLFEDDLAVVLKRYGIFTDRAWLPADKIPKADDEVLHTRQRLEAAMQPNLERGVKRPEAARLYVRESGFTYLNRLVGLKVLEVRSLFPETIQTRPEYSGRSLYQRDFRAAHPELATAADDALPAALEAACRDVSLQIRFVFDVESESSILWPRYAALKEAIQRINALPVEVWQEDEIIGWIYQFYNTHEKEDIRDRGKLHLKINLPIELAVVNQFFTPRWVVKYLVDNTLGRLWLEMHPDSQRVRAKCDYLVPEPLGVPEDGGEEGKIQLDPDSPVNNPDASPRREPKRPQDIRLIDPACGTMHFGHYAFEVFQEIYRDAREQGWVEGEDALEDQDIPLSILKHNLYGVDIDLRAVQLAALSLYVKARTSQRSAGMDDREAARLPWSVNLVCADAKLTNGSIRQTFLNQYIDDPVLQQVWKKLFIELEDIGHLGSLLRLQDRFIQLLQEYKPPSVIGLSHQKNKTENEDGFVSRQTSFSEISSDISWGSIRTIADMAKDLYKFSKSAIEQHDVAKHVFFDQAEKALSLLDLLIREYDVVVMNPPFGYSTREAEPILDQMYPYWQKNLLCAFYSQALLLTHSTGYIGMVSDKTFAIRKSYQPFREIYLLSKPNLITFLDLGQGVLDANVEACAFTTSNLTKNELPVFFDLQSNENKEQKLIEILGGEVDLWYIVSLESLRKFPFAAFGYKAPLPILKAFEKFEKIGDVAAYCPSGGLDAPADEYYRYHWEVPTSLIGKNNRFAPFWNGYSLFSAYYAPLEQVLLWGYDGKVIESEPRSNIRLKDYYFKECIGWGKRGTILDVCWLNGIIFSKEGQAIFPYDTNNSWNLIAFLNSRLAQFTINLYCGQHKLGSHVSQLPIADELIASECDIGKYAQKSYEIKKAWDTGNETSKYFATPWILQVKNSQISGSNQRIDFGETIQINIEPATLSKITFSPSNRIEDILDGLLLLENELNKILQFHQLNIDNTIYQLYEVQDREKVEIERDISIRPAEQIWPQMEGKSNKEKRKEHIRRLLSFFVLQSLKDANTGIIPLMNIGGEPSLMDHIRDKLESEFSEQRAFQFEREIAKELGKNIDNWLDGDFVQWHTRLYKKCPIIWHLASPKGIFACLVDYHQLKRDTLLSIRTIYLWRLRDSLRSKLKTASEKKDYTEISKLEEALTDIEEFDQALAKMIDSGWDPDIDAGVKANILPLQEAGLLRYKVV